MRLYIIYLFNFTIENIAHCAEKRFKFSIIMKWYCRAHYLVAHECQTEYIIVEAYI